MSANKLILPAKLVLMLAQFFLVLLIAYIRVSNHYQQQPKLWAKKPCLSPAVDRRGLLKYKSKFR